MVVEHDAKELQDSQVFSVDDEVLLAEFEYAVKRHHYDPVESRKPIFDIDEMRDEILRRMDRWLTID